MYIAPHEKVAIFIDGNHLYNATRNLGFDVDYRNLLEFFRKKGTLLRAYYYVALLDTQDFTPLRPLCDWLAYNSYTVVTKPAREYTDTAGNRRIQSTMDLEIATDIFELAPSIDHAVLVSGNGGFRRPIEAIKSHGVRVSVMSTVKTTPSMVGDDLRRVADEFVELAEVGKEFTRLRDTTVASPRLPAATPAEPFHEPDSTEPVRRRRATA